MADKKKRKEEVLYREKGTYEKRIEKQVLQRINKVERKVLKENGKRKTIIRGEKGAGKEESGRRGGKEDRY